MNARQRVQGLCETETSHLSGRSCCPQLVVCISPKGWGSHRDSVSAGRAEVEQYLRMCGLSKAGDHGANNGEGWRGRIRWSPDMIYDHGFVVLSMAIFEDVGIVCRCAVLCRTVHLKTFSCYKQFNRCSMVAFLEVLSSGKSR
jgi:hypothetical protein